MAEHNSPAQSPPAGPAADRWLALADMCRVFDVTPEGLRKGYRPSFPEDCVRREGRTVYVYAAGAIQAIISQRTEAGIRKAVEAAGGDPDLIGSDSPATERYRAAKADLAELQLARERRNVIETAAVHELLTRWADIWRGVAETARREGQPEVAQRFEGGLLECQHVIDELGRAEAGAEATKPRSIRKRRPG